MSLPPIPERGPLRCRYRPILSQASIALTNLRVASTRQLARASRWVHPKKWRAFDTFDGSDGVGERNRVSGEFV